MSKKSIYAQLDAVAVPSHDLRASPRHWNPGLLLLKDRLWMGYRYHRKETPDSRCGISITEIDRSTLAPIGASSRLAFEGATGTEHHEDCRLFMYRGEPHVSYSEMTSYRPGVDYTCVMKYARLKLTGNRWSVMKEWRPMYGANEGFSKEKNWVFFEREDGLYCVYAGSPEHVVLKVEGDKVVKEYKTPGPDWQWGHFRGGTPPLDLGDGRMLSIFHSSLPSETPPHYVRYYGAAYTFESKAPFRILQVSEMPLMAGSEVDGHKVDPRYVNGWKPFVVFPCGLVRDGGNFLCSMGVNDWQCAIARMKLDEMKLGSPDGSMAQPRFFRVDNGSVPVKYVNGNRRPEFIHWTLVRRPGSPIAPIGVMQVTKARDAVEVAQHPGATEITHEEFLKITRKVGGRQ